MYQPLLKTFVCVADCGSFNKAADQLFISPPSVMKQVNNLEKHLVLPCWSAPTRASGSLPPVR